MVRNKYHNKSCHVDGIRFASIAESRRYIELKNLKATGEIKDFQLQPSYLLQPAFRKCPACNHIQQHIKGSRKKSDILCENCKTRTTVIESINYIGDFLVIHNDNSETLEDVKGTKGYMDPVFKLKHKIFESKYPEKTIKIVVMSGRKK